MTTTLSATGLHTVTVLGAGAMGAAQCRPLADAGWEVRLWGTEYDDAVLDTLAAGQPHPRLGMAIPQSVQLFRADHLEAALAGADVVVVAVLSSQVLPMVERVLPHLADTKAIWLTSKGFSSDGHGGVDLLTDAVRRLAGQAFLPPLVVVAGPVIAAECAAGSPTAPVFACLDLEVARACAQAASTPVYAVTPIADEIGAEVCAALKNVYAIALGISEGMASQAGHPHYNLRAATFVQAVHEMSVISARMGADPATAAGLAGLGDLVVTGRAGRNSAFGELLGTGESAEAALAEMKRQGKSVEGVAAASLAVTLVDHLGGDLIAQTPLLHAVAGILDGSITDARTTLVQAALSRPTA